MTDASTRQELIDQNESLRTRLEEAQEVLSAIRTGSVDAPMVDGPDGEQVYTLQGADYPYRIFVETMNEGAVTIAADGTIIYANRLFADLIGRPLEKVLGSEIKLYVLTSDRTRVDQLLQEAKEKPSRQELCLMHVSEEPIPVQMSARHMPTKLGDCYCVVVTDLREQRVHEQLKESEARLRQADEQKSRLLYHVSHEYRTPLNSMLAISRLLLNRSDGDLTDEQEKQVRMIRSSAEQLLALVDDLLDLGKIQAGKLQLMIAPCSASQLFTDLRALFESTHKADTVRLSFDDTESATTVVTDRDKLKQILQNFIGNALKYTERGEVRVTAEPASGGRAVRFAVSDTGIGIAPDHQEAIFEEFVRVPHRLQGRTKGSGLGLALCRRLAEVLGGRIEVKSQPGVGSTFSVTVPVESCMADDSQTSRPLVLLIDDDENMRYIVRRMSGRMYDLREASDGATGLTMARDLSPEAILLDLSMPTMPGEEVLAGLQTDRRTAEIPVMIITSSRVNSDDDLRSHSNVYTIIDKQEVNPERLRNLLGDLTGRTRPRASFPLSSAPSGTSDIVSAAIRSR